MAVPSSGELSLFKIAKELEFASNLGYDNTMPYSVYKDSVNGATPVSLTNMSTGAGGFDAINTANAAADRPDGSIPHSMSEFYSYDRDKSSLTLITTITGQQHSASSSTRTSVSFNAGAYKGKTIRLLFHYTSGSGFRGDFQIDEIKLPYTIGSGSSTFWTQLNIGFGSNTSFSSAVFEPTSPYSNLGNVQTTRTDTTSHANATWYDITTGGSALRWNGNSGGTGSSGTGLTTMLGYHVYAETSSPGYSNKNFWMRTPEWDVPNAVGSGNIGFAYGAYGSNMGTLKLYVQEV